MLKNINTQKEGAFNNIEKLDKIKSDWLKSNVSSNRSIFNSTG
jgi:hypothetical protein